MLQALTFLVAILYGDPPAPIQFPDPAPQPVPVQPPAPPPNPAPIPKLDGAQLYVITGELPFVLLGSPNGLIKITTDAAPLKIRGVFWDSNGQTETRNYKPKTKDGFLQVSIVEANGTGRVELIAIPIGLTEEKAIVRRLVDVSQLPIPPPVPPQPPSEFQAKLQAAFTSDGSPAAQAATLAKLFRKSTISADATHPALVYDPGVVTGAALLKELHTVAQSLIGDSLQKTRRVIADELNLSFAKTGALDKATRDKIAEAFNQIAIGLEALK